MIAPSDQDHLIAHLRDRIGELEEENRQLRGVVIGGDALDRDFGLKPKEARIVRVILSAAPEFVSRDALIAACWDREIRDPRGMVEIHVSKSRAKLKAAGIEIMSAPKRGYRMSQDSAARLRELMARTA